MKSNGFFQENQSWPAGSKPCVHSTNWRIKPKFDRYRIARIINSTVLDGALGWKSGKRRSRSRAKVVMTEWRHDETRS